MKYYLLALLCFITLFLNVNGKVYYFQSSTDNLWSNKNNWQILSGLSYVAAGQVPTSSDIAQIVGDCANTIDIDGSPSISGLAIAVSSNTSCVAGGITINLIQPFTTSYLLQSGKPATSYLMNFAAGSTLNIGTGTGSTYTVMNSFFDGITRNCSVLNGIIVANSQISISTPHALVFAGKSVSFTGASSTSSATLSLGTSVSETGVFFFTPVIVSGAGYTITVSSSTSSKTLRPVFYHNNVMNISAPQFTIGLSLIAQAVFDGTVNVLPGCNAFYVQSVYPANLNLSSRVYDDGLTLNGTINVQAGSMITKTVNFNSTSSSVINMCPTCTFSLTISKPHTLASTISGGNLLIGNTEVSGTVTGVTITDIGSTTYSNLTGIFNSVLVNTSNSGSYSGTFYNSITNVVGSAILSGNFNGGSINVVGAAVLSGTFNNVAVTVLSGACSFVGQFTGVNVTIISGQVNFNSSSGLSFNAMTLRGGKIISNAAIEIYDFVWTGGNISSSNSISFKNSAILDANTATFNGNSLVIQPSATVNWVTGVVTIASVSVRGLVVLSTSLTLLSSSAFDVTQTGTLKIRDSLSFVISTGAVVTIEGIVILGDNTYVLIKNNGQLEVFSGASLSSYGQTTVNVSASAYLQVTGNFSNVALLNYGTSTFASGANVTITNYGALLIGVITSPSGIFPSPIVNYGTMTITSDSQTTAIQLSKIDHYAGIAYINYKSPSQTVTVKSLNIYSGSSVYAAGIISGPIQLDGKLYVGGQSVYSSLQIGKLTQSVNGIIAIDVGSSSQNDILVLRDSGNLLNGTLSVTFQNSYTLSATDNIPVVQFSAYPTSSETFASVLFNSVNTTSVQYTTYSNKYSVVLVKFGTSQSTTTGTATTTAFTTTTLSTSSTSSSTTTTLPTSTPTSTSTTTTSINTNHTKPNTTTTTTTFAVTPSTSTSSTGQPTTTGGSSTTSLTDGALTNGNTGGAGGETTITTSTSTSTTTTTTNTNPNLTTTSTTTDLTSSTTMSGSSSYVTSSTGYTNGTTGSINGSSTTGGTSVSDLAVKIIYLYHTISGDPNVMIESEYASLLSSMIAGSNVDSSVQTNETKKRADSTSFLVFSNITFSNPSSTDDVSTALVVQAANSSTMNDQLDSWGQTTIKISAVTVSDPASASSSTTANSGANNNQAKNGKSNSSSSNRNLAIGLGVGIGAGVVVIAAIGFFVYKKKRSTTSVNGTEMKAY